MKYQNDPFNKKVNRLSNQQVAQSQQLILSSRNFMANRKSFTIPGDTADEQPDQRLISNRKTPNQLSPHPQSLTNDNPLRKKEDPLIPNESILAASGANLPLRDDVGQEKSIILRETSLNNKTILDYRDYMNVTLDRTRSSNIFNESFVNDSGLNQLSIQDVKELERHAHSDLDTDDDDDPFFEYNKCHKHTKLELKDLSKNKFKDISISRFFIKPNREAPVEVNIADEI